MPHLVAACDDNVLRHWTMNKGSVAQHADLKKGAEFTASAAPMPELRGGHRGAVSAVTTYAPMSRRGEDPALNTPRIVSGSEDGTIVVHDARQESVVSTVRASVGAGGVAAVEWAPDGRTFTYCTSGGGIALVTADGLEVAATQVAGPSGATKRNPQLSCMSTDGVVALCGGAEGLV